MSVHNNLGSALARQGRLEEAIGHLSKALKIKPDCVEARNNIERALAEQAGIHEGASNIITAP
jgi:Flp pilus assembly protein TadD